MSVLKKDSYSRARGKSVILLVKCSDCERSLCYYQKDGPGQLQRMYTDRILKYLKPSQMNGGNMQCICGQLIATSMVYKKEKRSALRMYVGAVKKKVITVKEYEATT